MVAGAPLEVNFFGTTARRNLELQQKDGHPFRNTHEFSRDFQKYP